MGYQHKIFRYECGNCGLKWLIRTSAWNQQFKLSKCYTCKTCSAVNDIQPFPFPQVPRFLFIGHERNRQVKIYPFPPDQASEDWALPYSTRSFVFQASRQLGGCIYFCEAAGSVMGEPIYMDECAEPESVPSFSGEEWKLAGPPQSCDMLSGWTKGSDNCFLWKEIEKLCQSETEKKFLHMYLSLAKDRNFPMLIPQARIGIAERRRPDFVLFVPLQYFKYKWYAIELDGAHPVESEADLMRNMELEAQGYTVLSFRPSNKGYYEEVQKLLERIEVEMDEAERDLSTVVIDLTVTDVTVPEITDDDIPF